MSELYPQIYQADTLQAAFERVAENAGCRGSDGLTISAFAYRLEQNLRELALDLERQNYHPYPLMRFPVPKRQVAGGSSRSISGQWQSALAGAATLPTATATATGNPPAKFRYLSVPTVRDRIAQTAVFLVTREIFEAEFENVSHAYRPERGLRTAFWDIKEWRSRGYHYAVDADITSYFDTIPHDLLLQKLRNLLAKDFPGLAGKQSSAEQPGAVSSSGSRSGQGQPAAAEGATLPTAPATATATAPTPLLRLFEKWIKAEIYDGERIWQLEKGIPQGSVVSPYLANLFLDELDETLIEFGMKLVRYADDFLILTKTEQAAREAIELTDMLLEDMQLDLNPLKTKIVSFDHGFKFLGAIFLNDGIYVPLPEKRKQNQPPRLPPPLTLKRYLELKNK